MRRIYVCAANSSDEWKKKKDGGIFLLSVKA
jgi:hypothetical protein